MFSTASIRYSKVNDGNPIRPHDYERAPTSIPAYRRVGYSSPEEQRFDSAARTAAEVPHIQPAVPLLKDSSLLVTRDYEGRTAAELDLEEGNLIEIMERRDGQFWLGRLDGKEGLFPVESCDTTVPLKNNADLAASSDSAYSPDTSTKEATRNTPKFARHTSHETGDGENASFLAINNYRDRDSLFEFSLLDTDSNLVTNNPQGWTLLHHAAQRGDVNFAKLQLDAKVPIGVETSDGKTSLFIATNSKEDEHTEMVTFLIRQGANPLVKGMSGASLLHEQVTLNYMNNAAALLREGAYIEARNSHGESPPLLSARLGNAKFAAHLLKLGANVNACNFKGESSLFVAAFNGYASVIDVLLLSAKADLDLLSETGDSPFHAAASNGHEQAFRQLSSKRRNSLGVNNMLNGDTPLHSAVHNGQIKFIRAMASDHKLGPQRKRISNLRNHSGFTPLHCAASRGQELVGLSLIYGGADVKALDMIGWTALHHAATWGHVAFAQMLIEYGGQVILLPTPGKIERALEKHLSLRLWSIVSNPTSISAGILVILVTVSFLFFVVSVCATYPHEAVGSWKVSDGPQFRNIIIRVLIAAAFDFMLWVLMQESDHPKVAWYFELVAGISIFLSLVGSIQFVGRWMGILPRIEVTQTPLQIAKSAQQEEMVKYLSQFRALLGDGVEK